MTFTFSKDQVDILKKIDFSEIAEPVVFGDNQTSVTVSDSKAGLFLTLISDEIDMHGFSADQNEVLPYGRKLYAIYDSAYDQI